MRPFLAVQGIFPASFVAVRACSVLNEGQFETIVPQEKSLARETVDVAQEWSDILIKLFLVRLKGDWSLYRERYLTDHDAGMGRMSRRASSMR